MEIPSGNNVYKKNSKWNTLCFQSNFEWEVTEQNTFIHSIIVIYTDEPSAPFQTDLWQCSYKLNTWEYKLHV